MREWPAWRGAGVGFIRGGEKQPFARLGTALGAFGRQVGALLGQISAGGGEVGGKRQKEWLPALGIAIPRSGLRFGARDCDSERRFSFPALGRAIPEPIITFPGPESRVREQLYFFCSRDREPESSYAFSALGIASRGGDFLFPEQVGGFLVPVLRRFSKSVRVGVRFSVSGAGLWASRSGSAGVLRVLGMRHPVFHFPESRLPPTLIRSRSMNNGSTAVTPAR